MASSLITDRARHSEGISRIALLFFGVSAAAVLLAGAVTWLLAREFGRNASGEIFFPPAFVVSSLLLAAGSYSLAQARQFVRREKQRLFRRWLLAGLGTGALFMGVQSYGLWSLIPPQRSADAALGVTGFLLASATLHGLHFLVAVLFVAFVLARAWGDRYDHEYHWGVTVCAWFWHALGVLWLVILGVFAIVI